MNIGGSTPRVQGLGFRVLGFRFEVSVHELFMLTLEPWPPSMDP